MQSNMGTTFTFRHQYQVIAFKETNKTKYSIGGNHFRQTAQRAQKSPYTGRIKLIRILIDGKAIVFGTIDGQ